jgi:hypothetical protein
MKDYAILVIAAFSLGCNLDRADDGSPTPTSANSNGGQSNPEETDLLSTTWPSSVSSDAELKQLGLMRTKWYDLEFDGKKVVVAVETMPTRGESYIDVYGYVFNRSFKEWRRFLDAKTRDAGHIEISLDRDNGRLVVLGAANNDLNGKPLVTFDLAAVSDDRAYVEPER